MNTQRTKTGIASGIFLIGLGISSLQAHGGPASCSCSGWQSAQTVPFGESIYRV